MLIIAALVALAIGLAGWAAAGPLAEQARQLSANCRGVWRRCATVWPAPAGATGCCAKPNLGSC
ncbi:hypothetical protein ACFQU2_21260 [Siccirubricoccus deserti]